MIQSVRFLKCAQTVQNVVSRFEISLQSIARATVSSDIDFSKVRAEKNEVRTRARKWRIYSHRCCRCKPCCSDVLAGLHHISLLFIAIQIRTMFKFVAFLCVLLCAQQALSFQMNPLRSSRAISSLSMVTASKNSNVSRCSFMGHYDANLISHLCSVCVQVIGKTDLLTKLQESTSYKKKDLEVVINAFIDVIRKEVLTEGNELRLRDFGTFKQKKTAPRTGRNPKTGEPIKIGSSTSVTFSSSANSFRIKE